MKNLLLIFTLILFLPSSTSAQWIQTNGPVSVYIFGLADNGTDVFAGIGGFERSGLYRSSDHGANWMVIGFDGSPVQHIATDGPLLYAGLGNRIYRTTNLGLQWDTCNVVTTILSLAAGDGKVVIGSSNQGVFVSTNNGQSWTNSNAGLPELNIVKVSFSGSSICAAINFNGIYRSTDNGESWSYFGLNEHLFSGLYVLGNTVFAASEDSQSVYVNSGNDTNWSMINNGITGTIYNFDYNAAYVFASGDSGIFRTSNQGTLWERTDDGNLPYVYSLTTPGNEVFAGVRRKSVGIFRSTDSGDNWNSASGGLEMRKVIGIGSLSNYVFAGVEIISVKRSSNLGNTWFSAGPEFYLTGFAVNDHSLYASQIYDQAGVYRSSDLGSSWTDIGNGVVYDIWAFTVTNERVYALASNPVTPGLYMTTNDGINWTNVGDHFTEYVRANESELSISNNYNGLRLTSHDGANRTKIGYQLYLYAYENDLIVSDIFNGMQLTTNDGANWTSMNNGTPANHSHSIIAKDSMIFAAFPGFGVYVTTNKGESWSPVNNGLTEPNINCFYIHRNKLFAGSGSGVFVTANNGQIWSEISNGIESQRITSLSSDGRYLFAGTESSGVWRYLLEDPLPVELQSFTANVTGSKVRLDWRTTSELNNVGFEIQRSISGSDAWSVQGFVNGNVNSNNQNHYYFDDMNVPSGSYNYRLKQIDLNGNISIFDLSGTVSIGIPDKFALHQNYPNPFNPVTTIIYDLPNDGTVTIKLYDLLGREIRILLNEMKAAGYYKVILNAGDLAGGVYFCELKAGEFVAVRKLVVLK